VLPLYESRQETLDGASAARTAGAVLKYSEDLQTVRDTGFAALAADEP